MLDLSLFYFAADQEVAPGERFSLLERGARFADEHGFHSLWTPERHFHRFGGLYPSPVVTTAFLAGITKHVQLRAGSMVAPLHDAVRVAEEWSLADNLSGGRVGVSFASGWHPDDFVFAPDSYAARKTIMAESIATVRTLWGGGSVTRRNGAGKDIEVRILPRPIQPSLPIWVTASGTPETFRTAGQLGTHVLTHLLGQTVEQLKQKIALYRKSWREAGHAGAGRVTLMIHTFLADDAGSVEKIIREPFLGYLRTSTDLQANQGAAIASGDMDELLEMAYRRYVTASALFGSPRSCRPLLERIASVGVDELGCLIDFGVETELVMQSLGVLAKLKRELAAG